MKYDNSEIDEINSIIKELDSILEINKESIGKLVERENNLSRLEETSSELIDMAKQFNQANKELRMKEEPWYYKYKYYIGSTSTFIATLLFYLH